MKGHILSKQLKDSEIIAGTQAILFEDKTFRGLVTVIHLEPTGDWYVTSPFYTGSVDYKRSLHELVVRDLEDNYYPVVRKQWNSICHLGQINSGLEIEFEKRIYDFKEGLYEKPCIECESYFTADKRQSLCQACCNDRTEAIIIVAPKVYRETAYTTTKEISRIAFEAARENPTQDFENWFNTTH